MSCTVGSGQQWQLKADLRQGGSSATEADHNTSTLPMQRVRKHHCVGVQAHSYTSKVRGTANRLAWSQCCACTTLRCVGLIWLQHGECRLAQCSGMDTGMTWRV
jgi:hypothetical protein